MPFDADVLVVGAGPVGCVTALAFARDGARVMLLDPTPEQGQRFAGELLHPVALDALRAVGVDDLPPAADHPPVEGFAVYGDGEPAPFLLRYGGARGATVHFDAMLGHLRQVCADHPGITWMPRCRVTEVDGQTVTWEDRQGAARRVRTAVVPLVVGAVGRLSSLRAGDGEREQLSRMAGLLLRGVALPHEGFGHVVLGPVGPALIYRVGPDAVRVCLDVPTPWHRAARREQLVWEAYRAVLPVEIAAAVHAELQAGRVAWAVNALQPRTAYGRPGFAFVGDAVGHFHPMTAVGMTLGFEDALALSRAPSHEAYATARRRDTESPGLLATALYEIFTVQSEATAACRAAIFDMWRTDATLRARTMAFLACEETRMSALLGVGARLVTRAGGHVAVRRSAEVDVRGAWQALRRIGGLVHWLVNESVPAPMRIPAIQSAATPFACLRHEQDARLLALATEGAP
ncbi:MAG: FAD-dependent monooxygenase [Alphaproteobacteria bacterium]|nr:FAD-dependent monooxygenase [Alphaproteobacteria bacterium]